jgi:hypothetical protein
MSAYHNDPAPMWFQLNKENNSVNKLDYQIAPIFKAYINYVKI